VQEFRVCSQRLLFAHFLGYRNDGFSFVVRFYPATHRTIQDSQISEYRNTKGTMEISAEPLFFENLKLKQVRGDVHLVRSVKTVKNWIVPTASVYGMQEIILLCNETLEKNLIDTKKQTEGSSPDPLGQHRYAKLRNSRQ
jgi:hypothetical protein